MSSIDKAEENIAPNKLGGGVTLEQIQDAIRRSGYPLQTQISGQLRKKFRVQEEWSFIDKDSKNLRSLDIYASLRIGERNSSSRVRPTLSALIECKQSDLPYVFFGSGNSKLPLSYPTVCGLHNNKITLRTDDSRSRTTMPVINALDLRDHGFLSPKIAPTSSTFSKAARSGKKIELSGTDAFHNLIMPLTKALHHFIGYTQPYKTFQYHDLHVALAIGILDAPMIHVSGDDLSIVPWVRVLRHEAAESDHPFDRDDLYVIDVVHKDFFSMFISDHVMPFAELFADRALTHHEVLAQGSGFTSGLEAGRPITDTLRPK